MVNTARFSRFLMSAGRPNLSATLGLEVIGADACDERCVRVMRYLPDSAIALIDSHSADHGA